MDKNTLPKLTLAMISGITSEIAPSALSRWTAALAAKKDGDEEADDENVINIYDFIGHDPWTGGGFHVKKAAGILRNIGKRDVVVNINSPGGDLFEGIAVYNLFREHPGKITVRVIGLAASAASLIAMAGDDIQVARAGFMMIHNVWVAAVGNRNDLRAAADQLETFDETLADVYAIRTGREKKEVAKLMDRETWFSGTQAIEGGFADGLLPADLIEERDDDEREQATLRSVDTYLARRGIPRSERRALINQIKGMKDGGTQDAVSQATQDAGIEVVGSLLDFFKAKTF
jgi:ATP-dependent Clp protease protease subunit